MLSGGFLGQSPKPRFRKERVPKGKETLLLGQKGFLSLSIRMQKTISVKIDFPIKQRLDIYFILNMM